MPNDPSSAADTAWHLFIYRMPMQPSRARVGVWRALRRLGSLPLGQSIMAVPDLGDLGAALDAIEAKIAEDDGVCWRFRLDRIPDETRRRLVEEWNDLRTHEFAEIVEECETRFLREIEFEIFRGNLTASEAEEIEADLEKIQTWYARVSGRDWFAAPTRDAAQAAIAKCEAAYQDFAEQVYLAESREGPSTELPVDLPWGTTENRPRPATPLAPKKATKKAAATKATAKKVASKKTTRRGGG